MTYSRWNNAAQSERELFVRYTGWASRTKQSIIKKKAEQLTQAARLVINYTLTGNKTEWEP